MTSSNDFKKLIAVAMWAIVAVVYLAVFLLLTVSISSLFWDIKIGNDFISNNQMFFVQLIGYWLAGLVLLLITPKKYRDLGYRLLLAVVILLTAYYELPSIIMWRIDASLWYNFLWSVLVVAGLLAHLSVYLLSFSAIEKLFKADLKKPILGSKKVLVILVIVATISILATFGFSLWGLPHDWII